MTDEELRAFVRDEVHKALSEERPRIVQDVITHEAHVALGNKPVLDAICDHCTARLVASLRTQAGYTPRNMEYKGKDKQELTPDLPAWLKGLDR